MRETDAQRFARLLNTRTSPPKVGLPPNFSPPKPKIKKPRKRHYSGPA